MSPCSLEGTLERKAPATRRKTYIAERGTHPKALPFSLPQIEDREGESGEKTRGNLFKPPKGEAGAVAIWLVLPPGRTLAEFDHETQERFKASATSATDDPPTSSSSISTAHSSTPSTDLAEATNDAMAIAAPGAPPIPQDAVRCFVGDGAQKLIARAIAHAGAPLVVDEVLPIFLECYAKRLLETTRPYDGIPEALGR